MWEVLLWGGFFVLLLFLFLTTYEPSEDEKKKRDDPGNKSDAVDVQRADREAVKENKIGDERSESATLQSLDIGISSSPRVPSAFSLARGELGVALRAGVWWLLGWLLWLLEWAGILMFLVTFLAVFNWLLGWKSADDLLFSPWLILLLAVTGMLILMLTDRPFLSRSPRRTGSKRRKQSEGQP